MLTIDSKPLASDSPPSSRTLSRTIGKYSMRCPSESMTGWSIRSRMRATSSAAVNERMAPP